MAQPSSYVLQQYLTKNIIADEPWPDDTILYQPFEAEQILLAENASCLAVKAFLNICNKPFIIKSCINAEFMSPGGRMTKLPFIKVNSFLNAEFENIVSFMEQKNIVTTSHLDEELRGEIRAYVSLVENLFTCAELYITFVDEINYQQVTCVRNGCVFPWPLNHIQNFQKRLHVLKLLKVYQWKSMSEENVVDKVKKCCESLCYQLDANASISPYFFGDKPTELDAIVFGHIFTILTTKLPNNILAETVKQYQPLVRFCQNIDAIYFKKV